MTIDAPVPAIMVMGKSFILIFAFEAVLLSVLGFNVNKSSLLFSSAWLTVSTDWCVLGATSWLDLLLQTAANWLFLPHLEHTFPFAEHWLLVWPLPIYHSSQKCLIMDMWKGCVVACRLACWSRFVTNGDLFDSCFSDSHWSEWFLDSCSLNLTCF